MMMKDTMTLYFIACAHTYVCVLCAQILSRRIIPSPLSP